MCNVLAEHRGNAWPWVDEAIARPRADVSWLFYSILDSTLRVRHAGGKCVVKSVTRATRAVSLATARKVTVHFRSYLWASRVNTEVEMPDAADTATERTCSVNVGRLSQLHESSTSRQFSVQWSGFIDRLMPPKQTARRLNLALYIQYVMYTQYTGWSFAPNLNLYVKPPPQSTSITWWRCLSVCLLVRLSSETRDAACLLAAVSGCPGCFPPWKTWAPVKFMLAAGAYSWHP